MALDKFKVKRDEDGKLVANKCKSPNLGIVMEVIPLRFSQANVFEWFNKPFKNWSTEQVLEILENNVHSVDGEPVEGITEEEIDDLEIYVIAELLETVMLNSEVGRLYDSAEGNETGPEAEEAM